MKTNNAILHMTGRAWVRAFNGGDPSIILCGMVNGIHAIVESDPLLRESIMCVIRSEFGLVSADPVAVDDDVMIGNQNQK